VKLRSLLIVSATLLVLCLLGWGGLDLYRTARASSGTVVTLPSTRVKRGDVAVTVTAKAELQGGNSETISAPMTGGGPSAITFLRESGEVVKEGDIVVQFSTTEQEFKLREAEADLAEAEQQMIQAQAESKAKEEEARYALLEAKADLRVAQLETRRNELVPGMVAKQNDLAVESALGKVAQLEKDLNDRIATAKAGIAIQEAARAKARVSGDTAQRNIRAMTIKAKSSGYVARLNNMEGPWMWGAYQPAFQVGDTVQAGVGVAQIPDMKNWEAVASIGELDRGYLLPGQKAHAAVVALPGRAFEAHIKNIGGTAGPPWNRRFECRLTIDNPAPDLRPGMSSLIVITTDELKQVLWLPSQALFESDGRKFVYVQNRDSFSPKDVKLVRRSESQVVIEGLSEGQLVALASPEAMRAKPAGGGGGALKAVQK
jgi:HlyD family secretion protein